MNKVITSLEAGNNALLEAPTGSGKTLSLLCSALAWQQREKIRIEEGLAAARVAAAAQDGQSDGIESSPAKHGSEGAAAKGDQAHPTTRDDVGDGGFMPDQPGGADGPAQPRKKPPKIYYATRTHSQIAQVVRELKRSNYRPRMAILASRKQYCVNKFALSKPSVDETCDDLRADGDCKYHRNFMTLVTGGMGTRVHDIEDLCNYGRTNKACPYYASRKLADDAELIFGPYSYFIDPVIRRAISVDVNDSILIFDEAHNIEDVCREGASCEVDMSTMVEVAGSFNKAMACNGKPEVYGPLTECCSKILQWMMYKERETAEELARMKRPRPPTKQDPHELVFQAQPLLDQLAAAGLAPDKVDALWEAYQLAREEDEALAAGQGGAAAAAGGGAEGQGGGGGGNNENARSNGQQTQQGGKDPAMTNAVRVGAMALSVMSRLVQVVKLLHQVSQDGSRDYRLVVQRYDDNLGGPRFQGRSMRVDEDDSFASKGTVINFCLWCLNPAVAFKAVSEAAHSIILTSGTLAPLDSFASELGAPFKVKLEAPHVVDMRRQVWAGVVPQGPGGITLDGSYTHSQGDDYQDTVGRAVVECCATIPDGVLLFVSSYAMLDKLAKRWKATGLWKKLAKLKHVVQEPRTGGNEGLQKVMAEYYGAISRGEGGLFMAVCRGKVSEGLDFADANARGVIIVGIPFPSVKDTKVNEKRAFNNRGQRDMGLLSGGAWYTQQAFRALNQAVGRCIRHRYDWGAIVLVDDRFRQPRNQAGLSRWVRGALVVHSNFDSALGSMKAFFSTIQANPPQRPQPQKQAAPDSELAAAAAAAVAAAKVSAAAALGLPVQQHQQQHLELVAGGRVITQAAGRGAEGALGDWTTQHPPHIQQQQQGGGSSKPGYEAAPAGEAGAVAPGAAPGLYEAWQAKPLAQARLAPAGTAAAAGGAAGIPQHVQHPHQQARQQQQQSALLPRDATDVVGLVQQAPVAAWVSQDLQMYTAYLADMGVDPQQVGGVASLEALAQEAVKDAFTAAREFLQAGQPLAQLAAEWQSSLPRGLQAIVAAAGAVLPDHVPADPSAVAFGQQVLLGRPAAQLLEVVEEAYARVFQGLGNAVSQQHGPASSLADLPTQAYEPCEGPLDNHYPRQQQQQQQQQAQLLHIKQEPVGYSQLAFASTQAGPHAQQQQPYHQNQQQQPQQQQQQQQQPWQVKPEPANQGQLGFAATQPGPHLQQQRQQQSHQQQQPAHHHHSQQQHATQHGPGLPGQHGVAATQQGPHLQQHPHLPHQPQQQQQQQQQWQWHQLEQWQQRNQPPQAVQQQHQQHYQQQCMPASLIGQQQRPPHAIPHSGGVQQHIGVKRSPEAPQDPPCGSAGKRRELGPVERQHASGCACTGGGQPVLSERERLAQARAAAVAAGLHDSEGDDDFQ
ncbi:hypothetical protein N2152v2_005704 [Parachlorella kessleri]